MLSDLNTEAVPAALADLLMHTDYLLARQRTLHRAVRDPICQRPAAGLGVGEAVELQEGIQGSVEERLH